MRTETLRLTPELARLYEREWNISEFQRPLNRNHLTLLVEAMKHGEFFGAAVIIVCVLSDGLKVLIDGQHRLIAIGMSGTTQEVQVTYIEVADMGEARRHYAATDQGVRRKLIDAFRALGVSFVELSLHQAECVGKAAIIIQQFRTGPQFKGLIFQKKSAQQRYDLAVHWTPAAILFYAAIAGCRKEERRLMEQPQLMAVALATFEHGPANLRAREFWSSTAHDDGLGTTRPEKQMLIAARDVKSGQTFRLAHACAAIWNRWFRDPSAEVQRVGAIYANDPVSILGTPYLHGTDGVHRSVTGRPTGVYERRTAAEQVHDLGL